MHITLRMPYRYTVGISYLFDHVSTRLKTLRPCMLGYNTFQFLHWLLNIYEKLGQIDIFVVNSFMFLNSITTEVCLHRWICNRCNDAHVQGIFSGWKKFLTVTTRERIMNQQQFSQVFREFLFFMLSPSKVLPVFQRATSEMMPYRNSIYICSPS
jgi:hypothetical protein